MKRLAKFIPAVALALAGCSDTEPTVPLTKKEVLLKTLHVQFVLTSVPKEREENFYQIIDVFSAGRESDEFVRSVDFSSDTTASLSFSNGGMHGGGIATFTKKDGKWMIDKKLCFV